MPYYSNKYSHLLLQLIFVLSITLVPNCTLSSSSSSSSSRENVSSTVDMSVARRRLKQDAASSSRTQVLLNVNDFGAKGDGKSDDTQAFLKAWKQTCSNSRSNVVLLVPKNKKYLVKPITFSGLCKSKLIVLKIYGTILASGNPSDYEEDRRHWLTFENINNLVVQGPGIIDGKGAVWWKNSCKINKSRPCHEAPTAVTFYECRNLRVEGGMEVRNAQKMHISFNKCVNVEASSLMINSPEHSPNTDGIHITATQNIHVSKCSIKTGDDCISIETGSKNIKATDIVCGPGHGISIGSLGDDNSKAQVSNVIVSGAKLTGTTNGVRIKTWQGGSGYVKNIRFENIVMQNVTNPIIIDQNYCDQDTPCQEQSSAVQLQSVTYSGIKGTSASKVAVSLKCSNKYPCQGIVLNNVHLSHQSNGKPDAFASCQKVNLTYRGTVSPRCSSSSS